MREILFRGKIINGSEWLEGYFCYSSISDLPCIQDRETHEYKNVIPETVGQYTGLTDKNGTKIFEGDIVEFLFNDSRIRGKVFYSKRESAFVVYYELSEQRLFIHSKILCDCKDIEVIGNIYDNPELLEVEE